MKGLTVPNYFRSTMTQEWMNKEDADSLNLIDVANDFYTGGSHRLSKFGHFSEVDLR